MMEQMSLLGDNQKLDLENEIAVLIEQKRQKYGYFKMHVSGYFELQANAPSDETYDIIGYNSNRDGSFSLEIDKTLFAKIYSKKCEIKVSKDIFDSIFSDKKYECIKQPVGFVKTNFNNESEIIDFIDKAIDSAVKLCFPAHRFGCCSKYSECSKIGRCVHTHQFYSKGCHYRELKEK